MLPVWSTAQLSRACFKPLKSDNTPGWIADLRNQGVIAADDQNWFIENVLKVAAHKGLRRIAAIGFDDPVRKEYYNRMMEKTAEFGINLQVFHAMSPAIDWMKP